MDTYLKTLQQLSKLDLVTEKIIKDKFFKVHNEQVIVSYQDKCHGSFIIELDSYKFILTERPISYLNKKWGRCTNQQKRMINIKIPYPLYIGMGTIDKGIRDVLRSSHPQEKSNEWLFENFSIDIAIAYFRKYFSASDCLSPYKSIIF